jgi:hypothetical protein
VSGEVARPVFIGAARRRIIPIRRRCVAKQRTGFPGRSMCLRQLVPARARARALTLARRDVAVARGEWGGLGGCRAFGGDTIQRWLPNDPMTFGHVSPTRGGMGGSPGRRNGRDGRVTARGLAVREWSAREFLHLRPGIGDLRKSLFFGGGRKSRGQVMAGPEVTRASAAKAAALF